MNTSAVLMCLYDTWYQVQVYIRAVLQQSYRAPYQLACAKIAHDNSNNPSGCAGLLKFFGYYWLLLFPMQINLFRTVSVPGIYLAAAEVAGGGAHDSSPPMVGPSLPFQEPCPLNSSYTASLRQRVDTARFLVLVHCCNDR